MLCVLECSRGCSPQRDALWKQEQVDKPVAYVRYDQGEELTAKQKHGPLRFGLRERRSTCSRAGFCLDGAGRDCLAICAVTHRG